MRGISKEPHKKPFSVLPQKSLCNLVKRGSAWGGEVSLSRQNWACFTTFTVMLQRVVGSEGTSCQQRQCFNMRWAVRTVRCEVKMNLPLDNSWVEALQIPMWAVSVQMLPTSFGSGLPNTLNHPHIILPGTAWSYPPLSPVFRMGCHTLLIYLNAHFSKILIKCLIWIMCASLPQGLFSL